MPVPAISGHARVPARSGGGGGRCIGEMGWATTAQAGRGGSMQLDPATARAARAAARESPGVRARQGAGLPERCRRGAEKTS
jgi:hypothetical protein